jgi:hypothetical protein
MAAVVDRHLPFQFATGQYRNSLEAKFDATKPPLKAASKQSGVD